MLKFKVALIAILVGCVAFVSCDRTQKILEPVADDMMTADDMPVADDMMAAMMMDLTAHRSWMHVMLPAPVAMDAATSPAETGAAHNPPPIDGGALTARTVYINDIGAMANKAGAAAYPAGTVIVKEIMDKTETFVDKVAVMMKSDDMMYAGHNGWVYKKYLRSSVDAEYMQIRGSNLEDAGNGCHGCHIQADNDSVFVSLSMDADMTDGMMDADMTDEGMNNMAEGMEGNGAGAEADAGDAQ